MRLGTKKGKRGLSHSHDHVIHPNVASDSRRKEKAAVNITVFGCVAHSKLVPLFPYSSMVTITVIEMIDLS
jgi:hypothetical protein